MVVTDTEPGGGGSEGVGTFFNVVTQAVLLFGAETWLLTASMEQAFNSFQQSVAQWITGSQLRIQGGGIW